jgi:hypothetical protein
MINPGVDKEVVPPAPFVGPCFVPPLLGWVLGTSCGGGAGPANESQPNATRISPNAQRTHKS